MDELTDIVLDEKIENTTKEPNKYNVIFLNDDSTPMDWVIYILMSIFKHSAENAQKITMSIHEQGSGVAGSYHYEIAEQKAIETTNSSRAQGYPLKVTLEEQS